MIVELAVTYWQYITLCFENVCAISPNSYDLVSIRELNASSRSLLSSALKESHCS